MSISKMEQNRKDQFDKAAEDWKKLTEKETWPEEEHQARFEALVRKMLFMPPVKK